MDGDNRINEQIDEKIRSQKEVAYYDNIVRAWIENDNMMSKSLLYLSSGGIVLLVNIITQNQTELDDFSKCLLALSSIGFLFCIFFSFYIHHLDFKILKGVVREEKSEQESLEKESLEKVKKSARRFDYLQIGFFVIGILTLTIFILKLLYK